jgi:hypothetical protein
MRDDGSFSGLVHAKILVPVGALVATTLMVATATTAQAAVTSTAPTVHGQLVRTSDLSKLDPTSPDPSGVSWMPDRGRLMIVDGEVDEMPLYEGTNLYETTLDPTVTKRGTTLPLHLEPTGVAYNQANGHLFVSNDDLKRVYEVDDGADSTFGTADDVVSGFSTAALGNTDPEDVAYDDATGDLFIVDGLGARVSRVSAGGNGRFDGVPPVGDDTWSGFDLAILGASDPEGISYDRDRGTLLVVDDSAAKIFELTRYGSLINAIDITALSTQAAAGVTVAPRYGDNSQRSYYVVDRGLDNNSHPTENDGRMFELSASLPAVDDLPPWSQAGPDLEIELPESAALAGVVTDPDTAMSGVYTEWSVLNGPGAVQFADANDPATTATFTVPGLYTLRLSSDDGNRPDIDDVTVTVVEEGGVHTTGFPVQVGTDDAEEAASGFVSAISADLELVDEGTVNQTVGVRFADLSIPRNAVIENAFIQFQTDEVSTGAASLHIHGEAVDHATTYLDRVSGNITGRPTTVSSTAWSPDPWSVLFEAGPAQRTPDIGQIVQEIVDRPGWTEGNAMAFMVSGSGTRTAEARDGTAAPVLQVGWRRPVEGANRAPVVSAGVDQEVMLPAAAELSGSVSDDGLPASPGVVTAAWSKVAGPGAVTFADAASAVTSVSFGEAGVYTLAFTGDDGELQTSDEVLVSVVGADTTQSASVSLAGGADDASEGGGSSGRFVTLTGNDLELGTDVTSSSTFSTLVGLRYSLPVPAGAVVDSATVRFTVDEVSTDAASVNIQAVAADDVAPFATGAGNLSDRHRGDVSVSWAPAAWSTVNASGAAQTTTDFAAVLQQVVDRPGWAAGNHAAILFSGTGRRTADSYEGGAAKAAVLDITWHMPS